MIMDWKRSCSQSVMQVLRPDQRQTYFMPVIWYKAPKGALTFPGVNAFSSGIWDRDTPAQPPTTGEQPPYNSPYWKGENLWAYTGQCFVGTLDQFEHGLTLEELNAPPPANPPDCCRPAFPPQPVRCNWYQDPAWILPQNLIILIQPTGRTSAAAAPLLVPIVLSTTPFVPCVFETTGLTMPDGTPYYFTLTLEEFITNITFGYGIFANAIVWDGPRLDSFPQTIPFFSKDPSPPLNFLNGLADSTVLVYPYVSPPVPTTITLAGDVNGTGTTLIATSLALIVAPGTFGDATNVPQITIDGAGRVISVTEVPISGGGGVAIGDAVGSGTPTSVLFVDSSGNLAQATGLTYDASLSIFSVQRLIIAGGLVGINGIGYDWPASLPPGVQNTLVADSAGNFSWISDGSLAYTAGTPADWSGAAPADIRTALDRIAAALFALSGPIP